MRITILIITLIFIFAKPLISQVDETEKGIIQSVDDHNSYYVELLKEIVNINSGTMNLAGVRTVGDRLMIEFEKLGLDARWIDGEPFGRAGHLMAEINGNRGPRILIIGHLDTVFEPDSPFQSYSMVNDSIMKGPGVADMKGGDVIILMALQALKDVNMLEEMQIKVILTGDEEKSGNPLDLSKKALMDGARWADVALAFENGDGIPGTIAISRRGWQGWKLEVSGTPAHSSQIFTSDVGVGAIYEASRILHTFYQQLSHEKDLTFNPGVIVGGTTVTYDESHNRGSAFGKSNVVAQDVVVTGDLRAVSLDQLEKVKERMTSIVADHYPATSAVLTFQDGGYPPMSPTEGNQKLLSYYSDASEDLGFGPVTPINPRDAGAADVSFASGLVDMAIDGLGLSGSGSHTIDETGDISKLPVQSKIASVLMYRLVNGGLK